MLVPYMATVGNEHAGQPQCLLRRNRYLIIDLIFSLLSNRSKASKRPVECRNVSHVRDSASRCASICAAALRKAVAS